MQNDKHTNQIIREELAKRGLFLWHLAKFLHKSEATVTRLMREELPEEEQRRIVKIIQEGGEKNV